MKKVFKEKSNSIVRIMSGLYRGSQLITPGVGTHPMGAREKLALFNMLAPYLEGTRVLDAYAGSGALGLEALSRGAKEVVFIEKSQKAREVIEQNLRKLGLLDKAQIFGGEVKDFRAEIPFDVIVADPPYNEFDAEEVSRLAKFLKNGGIFVLSHPGKAPELEGLTWQKTRSYAAAQITVYVK